MLKENSFQTLFLNWWERFTKELYLSQNISCRRSFFNLYLSNSNLEVTKLDIYLSVLKKYAVFSGRASRREYWTFVILNFIIIFLLELVEGMIWDGRILSAFYSLFVMIPGLAVFVRRLHDTNRSGWWFFISLIPLIGAVVLFVFTIQSGTPGQNRYGHPPADIYYS